MNETAENTNVTYDPVPDLARLLCAAQRQGHPLPGLEFVLSHLMQGLGLPQLAYSDEAETAIRESLEAQVSVTKGDVITIVPEHGRSRRMLVSHVEHHVITLADLDECPIEAVFGGGDEERYPCTYAKGHAGPHSFAHPNTYPPSAADLRQQETGRPAGRTPDAR